MPSDRVVFVKPATDNDTCFGRVDALSGVQALDTDIDRILNENDNCQTIANTDQSNFDGGSEGDLDDDNDAVPDTQAHGKNVGWQIVLIKHQIIKPTQIARWSGRIGHFKERVVFPPNDKWINVRDETIGGYRNKATLRTLTTTVN